MTKRSLTKIFVLRVVALLALGQETAFAFPSVCSVVKTPAFNSCVDLSITPTMCGFPPRPCAHFSYYMPVTFIESISNPKETFFGFLPGAATQLATMGKVMPFGAEDDQGGFSFQSHALTVPFLNIPFRTMPCQEDVPIERWCFEAMSEHVDTHWRTGSGDQLQPAFLAWKLSPKACLLFGAATSIGGQPDSYGLGAPLCSFPNPMPKYPPSQRQVCNGWGIFFPRYGTYDGGSQTIGALMIADRMKSLGAEVFHSVGSNPDDKWQMITPTQTQCFRTGQNVGFLEIPNMVNDTGRLQGKEMKNYLFTVWRKVSCTKDLPYIATTYAALGLMQAVCQGL